VLEIAVDGEIGFNHLSLDREVGSLENSYPRTALFQAIMEGREGVVRWISQQPLGLPSLLSNQGTESCSLEIAVGVDGFLRCMADGFGADARWITSLMFRDVRRLSHGVGLSSPAFGFRMPEQKGWAGLEPETPKPLSDLKQKKWLGIGQNELAGGPKALLTAAFWPITFPRARFHCPTFCPYFCLGRGSWPSNGMIY
jgi:hypothetical protein